MTELHAFASYNFPVVHDGMLTCIGVQLTDDTDAWLRASIPFVTETERTSAQRFVHPIDAARHLVGRALIRRTLNASVQQPLTADFSYTPWGKPFWPHSAIDFSITHSGNMVWAAFCHNGKVGIDVEEIRTLPDIAELAAMLHPSECEAIKSLPPAQHTTAFYRCWTRKEAVLKATGTGLNLALNSFQVRTGQAETNWIICPPQETLEHPEQPSIAPHSNKQDFRTWTTHDLAVGTNYHCSVAAYATHVNLAVLLVQKNEASLCNDKMTGPPIGHTV